MKRKLESAPQAVHEYHLEKTLQRLRAWRDQAGKDRVLLFGENHRYPETPAYCLLVERTGRLEGRAKRFRGVDDLDAARAALGALETWS